ncbi:MAG TPA: hypothetical protein VLX92_30900 [Kofleriaceae bacterium]|nr:hypothetical protein [Kofleriaceae bacterium]
MGPRRIGDYRIAGEVRRDHRTIVYVADHQALDRQVALRVMTAEAARLPRAELGFLNEARVLDRLHHPCVPRVYECGVHAGQAWFATDLVIGPSLAELVAGGARIDVACLLRDLSAILQHAARRGIALRGIAADRVACVAHRGGIVLCIDNWSFARGVLDAPGDVAASVYALGVVAFQAMTGVLAFAASTMASLAGQGSVRSYWPHAPRDVAALLDRMLARDPARRPTLAEVHDAALRLLDGPPIAPAPDFDEITHTDIAIAG